MKFYVPVKRDTAMKPVRLPLPIPATTRKDLKVMEAVSRHLHYLRDRWDDEAEYESFSDYQLSAKTAIEQAGGTFVSLTERPFAARFTVNGEAHELRVLRDRVTLTRVHLTGDQRSPR